MLVKNNPLFLPLSNTYQYLSHAMLDQNTVIYKICPFSALFLRTWCSEKEGIIKQLVTKMVYFIIALTSAFGEKHST